MAEPKTKLNDLSAAAFLAAIPEKQRREDCQAIAAMMEKATKSPAKMWGSSIVGFGTYTLKYPSGREADWMMIGFSPRKSDQTLYVHGGAADVEALYDKLGKHKRGTGCLYIKSLADVDQKVLQKIITAAVKHVKAAK